MFTTLTGGVCSAAALRLTRFVHLLSGLDDSPVAAAGEGAVPTSITGYTEWIGGPGDAWSLGWDWRLEGGSCVLLRRTSCPATNVILIAADGTELAQERADQALANLVDTLAWQREVLVHIGRRYRP